MKKTNLIFSVLLATVLIGGLWYKNAPNRRKYEQTEYLFDTECTVTAFGRDAKQAVQAAFGELSEIHRLCDSNSENSDISKINRAAADTKITIDPRTYKILETALKICADSNGAFDITIAPISALWDFKSENAVPPPETSICQSLQFVGYSNIILSDSTVTKKSDKTEIDLGGAAKGYAADRALEIIKKYRVDGALVDLGGNVSCFGKNKNSKNGQWRIGIQIPFKPTGEYGQILSLNSGSVVTSGTYQRNFEYGGKLYHHILDPKTGYPSEQSYSSVTVITDSALIADCLSTACFVLGREQGEKLAEKYGAELYYQ